MIIKRLYTLLVCSLLTTQVQAQITAGLIAHWKFNGNTNDSSGNGHNGTPVNVTPAAGRSGKPNTAYVFNGTSSKINVPYQSDLNTSKYSVCAVVKLNGFYTGLCQGNNVFLRGSQGGAGSYVLQINDNNTDSSCTVTGDTNNFRYNMGRGGTDIYHKPWMTGQVLHTGSWHCVVATFNDTVYKVYIDGNLQVTVAPHINNPVGTSTEGIVIGANEFGNWQQYPYWFNGVMDDLRLYNRALTATEVLSFCGNPDDTTVNTTNIQPLVQTVQLAVYPNPTNGDFTVAGMMPEGKATVTVYNAVGQLVHTEIIHATAGNVEHKINLNGKLADGMYMVNISTSTGNSTHRLLVRGE